MYSVFVNKRPVRFAFLVDPRGSDWQEQLDAVWEYHIDKWGGRFNTVVPTNGNQVDDVWWQFLKKTDPDYVIATIPLSDELLELIRVEICPIELELPRPNQSPGKPHILTHNDTIRVVPTSRNISALSGNPFLEGELVVVRCDYDADEDVKRFVLRNIGLYPNVHYSNRTLKTVKCQEFSVDTKAELIDMLNQLNQPPSNHVYPIQIPALENPRFHLDYQHEHSYEVFGLIVGDTFEDQIFSWHKLFYSKFSDTRRLNHLWLPTTLANDLAVMEALGEWLRRMTEYVNLFSFSISEGDLNEIGERLELPKILRARQLYRSTTLYNSFPFPRFDEGSSYSFSDRFAHPLSLPKEADYYRAYGLNEEFEIKGPALAGGLQESGAFIAEVFVEADRNRFYDRKDYLRQTGSFWWQLPRKNHLAASIFKAPARINSHGIPTIQLPAKAPQLKFHLPDERELLRRCVLGDIVGRMSGQAKCKSLDIDDVAFSNIGKYLRGFLEVFGGLAVAHSVLSERYWRNMFDVLSGRDLAKDEKVLENVRGRLRKHIKKGLTASEIVGNFANLADYVIQLSREVTSTGETKEFGQFQLEAEKEHEEFKKENKVDWAFDKDAVKREISTMLEAGALQMGFEQKCRRCGSVNWFLIDQVRQSLVCDGCRYSFSLPAEPAISYRLNSLVRKGIFTHGLVPVVLVLGQLLEHSRTSFFFSPSLDVFELVSEQPLKHQVIGDLDIVCIKDGQLIVGEVKLDQARFDVGQSLKLAEIAEMMGADVLLFSSLEKEQRSQTREMISKVKEKLKASRIQVCWYQLGQEVFEPSRMDH